MGNINRRRTGSGVLIIVSILLSCSIIGYQLLVKHCLFLTCAPTRSFTVLDLGLPIDFFPGNAVSSPIHPASTTEGAVSTGIMSVHWREGKGGAIYNVWRFGTENQAARFYRALFNDASYSERDDLTYMSQIADQYNIGCGMSEFGGYRCDVIARYEEFVLSFNTTIDDEMSVSEFQKAVIFIDEQMERYLYSDGDEQIK